MSLEENIKERVMDLGADFVGIASHSRFEGAPEVSSRQTLLPILLHVSSTRNARSAESASAIRRCDLSLTT